MNYKEEVAPVDDYDYDRREVIYQVELRPMEMSLADRLIHNSGQTAKERFEKLNAHEQWEKQKEWEEQNEERL